MLAQPYTIETKKIVLVDDHVIVRDGLKELIEKIGPYKVTAEFDNGSALLNAVPLSPIADLIVLDLNMPGMNGEQTVRALNAAGITTPVLVLTLNNDEQPIVQLFRLGVRGYLQKNCSAAVLRKAIADILEYGYYHNEFLNLSLKGGSDAVKKSAQETILGQMTAREREFLILVCDENEYTYEQIADRMKVQHRTVDGYREALFSKFGIRSKTGLALFVIKHDLFKFL